MRARDMKHEKEIFPKIFTLQVHCKDIKCRSKSMPKINNLVDKTLSHVDISKLDVYCTTGTDHLVKVVKLSYITNWGPGDLSGGVVSKLDYKVRELGSIPSLVMAQIATSNSVLGDYLIGHCCQQC